MITKLFEDDSILVLDKPTGVVVNNSQTAKNPTVQTYISENYDFSSFTDEEFLSRSGIVHRLDKDTSGLLVVAKNPEAFHTIKNQFKEKKVQKEYLAVVLGEISDKSFEIDAPIKRDPKYRMKMSINSSGREAKTLFTNLEVTTIQDTKVTKLMVRPLTGRMHQIRVHLLAINHPVMGDPIYMTRQQYMTSQSIFNRLMLHAHKISFMHPVTSELVSFEAAIPHIFNF